MKDYEQLYYDLQYELKQLKTRKEQLEEELDIYKKYSNKKLTSKLINEIFKYIRTKGDKYDKK